MTSTVKERKIGSLGTSIGLLALGVSLYAAATALKQQGHIEALRESQAAVVVNNAYTFKTEADFKKAVVSALNEIVQQKQKTDLDGKMKKFELAAEKAPDGRKIYGNLDARFTLVEFSETECPYCVKHQTTLKTLVDASKGNINWEWKHLPLGFHNPAAMTQAIVGECVAEQLGNRAFWVYIDEVFKQSGGNGQGVKDLPGLVESLGVDIDNLRKCAAGADAKAIVDADLKMASDFNINGTPATFVVDNVTGNSQIVSGAQPVGAFSAVIKRLMDQGDSTEEEASETKSETNKL